MSANLFNTIKLKLVIVVTQRFVSLCPRYTGVRPDIWLGLVSLGSEGLSRPRCGIYCKII